MKLVVVSAGLTQPSSTRLRADRLVLEPVARDLGAPPWAVAERASEDGLFSAIAEVPIS